MATIEQALQPTVISLVELKRLAQRLLPSGSTLRAIIMSEPDTLPRSEAFPKMEIFVQLLYRELKVGD